MLAKTGPRRNLNCRWPVAWSSWMTSVPVMSEGIRSGVNWMRLKVRFSASASVRISSVLARPGTPIEQAVAAGEDGDQQLLDHRVLADDHLAHLGLQEAERLLEALHGGQVVTLQRVGRIRVGVAHAETSVKGMVRRAALAATAGVRGTSGQRTSLLRCRLGRWLATFREEGKAWDRHRGPVEQGPKGRGTLRPARPGSPASA